MGTAKALINAAMAEVGYTEQGGYSNLTKFGEEYGLNGVAWCDIFVSIMAKHTGNQDAVGYFSYCPSHVGWFANKCQWHWRKGYTPCVGDIIFFDDDTKVTASKPYDNAGHVGIVYAVTDNYVSTIEGNTSGAAYDYDGGGVFKKCYNRNSTYILGYGHPDYDGNETAPEPTEEVFEVAKAYHNGSTDEICYADTALTLRTGSLNPYEECECLGVINGRYLVRYLVDGTENTYKVGFVEYSGGIE